MVELNWADFLDPRNIWWHGYLKRTRGSEYADFIWANALLSVRTLELQKAREENHNA